MKRWVYLILIVMMASGSIQAQQEMNWPVYVDHFGNDFIGKQVMIKVNNDLAKHKNYTKLDTSYNGDLGYFRIMITSVATTTVGDWSAMSVVYTLELPDSPFGIYLNSAVYFRNKDTTDELTGKIIASMDIAIQNYSVWRKAKDRTLRVD